LITRTGLKDVIVFTQQAFEGIQIVDFVVNAKNRWFHTLQTSKGSVLIKVWIVDR
jgi:hypothetical protein